MPCSCTDEYNAKENGVKVRAYCEYWDSNGVGPWCYLNGGSSGKNCPGAIKSGNGNFYWTKDADICRAAQKSGI